MTADDARHLALLTTDPVSLRMGIEFGEQQIRWAQEGGDKEHEAHWHNSVRVMRLKLAQCEGDLFAMKGIL